MDMFHRSGLGFFVSGLVLWGVCQDPDGTLIFRLIALRRGIGLYKEFQVSLQTFLDLWLFLQNVSGPSSRVRFASC